MHKIIIIKNYIDRYYSYICRMKVSYKRLFARLSTKFINTRAYWRCIFLTNTFYLQRLQTAQANRNARAFCKRQRERVLTHFAQLPRLCCSNLPATAATENRVQTCSISWFSHCIACKLFDDIFMIKFFLLCFKFHEISNHMTLSQTCVSPRKEYSD